MAHETDDPEWHAVTTPFDADLGDVAQTAAGPFAVGTGGAVVADRGNGWETVVSEGPASENSTLAAAAATADGERVWYAGASGAIGAYDLAADEQYDFSYAEDVTASWGAIAVSGSAGGERVWVANASGTVLPLAVSGREATYGASATPGSGSEITAMAATADGVVHATDTAGNVFRTTPSGWTRAGVEAAEVSLRDVAVAADGRVFVAAANGALYAWDPSADRWTADEVATSALRAVAVRDEQVVVLSADNVAFRRPVDERTRWRRAALPTGNDVLAVALDRPDVAVGKAGTVLTRAAPEAPAEPKAGAEAEGSGEPTAGGPPVCDLLRAELIARLDREELVAALEATDECQTRLVEALSEGRSAERRRRGAGGVPEGTERVVALPVAADAAALASGDVAGRAPCDCRSRRRGRAIERLLEC